MYSLTVKPAVDVSLALRGEAHKNLLCFLNYFVVSV